MSLLGVNERSFMEDPSGGEIEVEKLPVQEVDIRQKDLLPVFDHFHRIQAHWRDR